MTSATFSLIIKIYYIKIYYLNTFSILNLIFVNYQELLPEKAYKRFFFMLKFFFGFFFLN